MPQVSGILAQSIELTPQAEKIAQSEGWPLLKEASPDLGFYLMLKEQGLVLRDGRDPKGGDVWVDWSGGAVAHRRNFGGGRGQAIAKACGLKSGETPSVIDATAGLGRDAMVLASLGCQVSLIERSPVVAALLRDGYERACHSAEIGDWVKQRIKLYQGSAPALLPTLDRHDVVYLDPMFPHRQKSAQVKKEMRVFQSVVGDDPDADKLLQAALAVANKRVVVKRPDYAEPLAGKTPHHQIKTKKNRFDVYMCF